MESMPLIQRLLQRDTGSPGSGVQPGLVDSNMTFHSSLPESAFLDILSALKPRPDFPQLLATANEHGQTLLHLAVDLRYRELVQKLIHWGVDPNIRDVNGFTALHAAYLCDDPFVIGVLKEGGATPFILDELGRSPTGLTATIPGTSGMTTNDDEIVPSDVGVIGISRLKERCEPPDPAMPVETQKTSFESTADEAHRFECVFFY